MPTSVNRREFLAATLGSACALGGCGRDAASVPPLPPGELVGASAMAGHRLRGGLTVAVPADRWERTRVVIVGAGAAGLSAARRLRMGGLDDFQILEIEPAAGGTSRSGRNDVVRYPWGAHYLPAPTADNAALVDLLDEMGVLEGREENGDPIVAEPFLCRDPDERVFYRGGWHPGLYVTADATPDDLAQHERFRAAVGRWAAWRDGGGRRAFTLPMSRGSDDPHATRLDRLNMAEWMEREGFTSRKLRWLVDYACRDDYGLRVEQTSAWAGLFYFAARIQKPDGPSRPFITWPEGNGRIVRHLADPVRDRVRLGWAVAEIVPRDDDGRSGVDVAAVSRDGQAARGFHAERVIFACPQFLAPHLIRPWRDDPPPHVADFSYGAWAVVNVALSDRPRESGYPLCWDNVIADSRSLGYVAATHQALIDYGPTVFTWYLPLCDDDPRAARQTLLDGGRDEWAEAALTDLEAAHPDIRSLATRVDVMRWGHAMVRAVPGSVWGGGRARASRPYRGIAFAHSDLSGLPLFEEAFDRGTRAAEWALRELGYESESIL
jgi:hypothetical protein